MGRSQKDKGARGERELASALREYGYQNARRGCQKDGKTGVDDVEGLPGIHIECKRTEAFRLWDALSQAERDAQRPGEIPAVFHRRNNGPWIVVMTLDDWINLYREWEAGTS